MYLRDGYRVSTGRGVVYLQREGYASREARGSPKHVAFHNRNKSTIAERRDRGNRPVRMLTSSGSKMINSGEEGKIAYPAYQIPVTDHGHELCCLPALSVNLSLRSRPFVEVPG